jgi:hypothetical protein
MRASQPSKVVPWIAGLGFVWAGMILGVCFLASPVKFAAPSLSMTTALEVGRLTFAAFHKVEGVLALLWVGLLAAWGTRKGWLLGGGVIALWVVQVVGIMPVLDRQTAAVLQGGSTAMTVLHFGYVGAETLKLGLLIALSAVAMRAQGRPAPETDAAPVSASAERLA